MQPRMKSPALTLTGARDALLSISKSTESSGVPRATLELVHLRVGQINMHTRALEKLGESRTRIFVLAAWRESPYYSEAERAALALAESLTRLGDRSDAVPDALWKEATAHFSEPQLAALVMAIGLANLWNRLNAATRQVAGEWVAQYV